MERDFMGLAVKQETSDETIDAVPVRSLAMQWSFSNKGSSAVPQLLSFQGGQEDNSNKLKTGFDSLTSTGLVTVTTRESFESEHKSYTTTQKNVVHQKQGGIGYTMTTNQKSPTHSYVSTSGHNNLIGSVRAPMKNPVAAIPSTSPVVGTTDLRNSSKISGAPTQLTIFFNGSVCVFDNISPEKAQAIMLLAGNGTPTTPTAIPSPTPLQTKVTRSSILDGHVLNQTYGKTPQHCSPVPLTSITVSHSAAAKPLPAGVPVFSSNIVGPSKAANSLGPVSGTFLSQDTVPQFRRKSLARFLEKRKERVISASSPYGDKKSLDNEGGAGGAAGRRNLSANSSGSCPVTAIN
ncbi:hypothetical protein ABFX02_09G006700 [Erythranthe guttata]